MTDLEKFIELYQSFGIELKIKLHDKEEIKYCVDDNYYPKINRYHQYIDLKERIGKFIGYSGFYSRVEFDKDGNFLEQGAWE